MRPRIALATSEGWPHLSPDDGDLISELAAAGCDAVPAVWSDRDVDWKTFDHIVIRSCWDYHRRPDEFRAWLDLGAAPISNRPDIVRWNMHKSYLLELEARGIRIPPTRTVRSSDAIGSEAVVVKPAISASAFETHFFQAGPEAAETIDRLSRDHDVIVQSFVPEIVTRGEWSLIFFAGAFSHAVRKLPKSGDFRVQQELGGSAVAADPPAAMLRAAERALHSLDVLYARVDLVEASAGVTLMELELIEPSLFLKTSSGAAKRFAEAICDRRSRA